MVDPVVKLEQQGDLFLPPGFRFHPTDEEIITSYLLQKFLNPSFAPRAIGEVNLNRCEPWDLPSKAKMGEKEWYFFCHKDMKYPTGTRTNRATEVGYWKATGKDREIFKPASVSGGGRELVGMKKTLVFYMGRAPKGSKTNWVMHEYRLHGKSRDNNANIRFNRKDEWVVSKVFHKKGKTTNKAVVDYSAETPNVSSVEAAEDDEFLDPMVDPMYLNTTAAAPYYSISSATAETTMTTDTFADLPNYSFMNDTTTSSSRNPHRVTVANNPTVPGSNSYYSNNSSWNMLHADNAMENYSLQHQQAIMMKALGRVISQNVAAGGLPSSSAATTRVSQPNSLGVPPQRLGNYGGGYSTHLTSSADTAIIGAAAWNLGDPPVRY